jgi:ADP-ribosylglycohydrolase
MIEVKADEAAAKNLAPIGFSIDPSGAGMVVSTFPRPEMYLHASGPPGGPLAFVVWAATAGGAEALARAVQARFGGPALVVGDASTIELAGASRPALSFVTGSGISQTAWCGALVETSSGAMLVAFGAGSVKPLTCAQVAAHPALSMLVRSFKLGAQPRAAAYAPAIGIVEDDFGPRFTLPVPKSTVAIRGWDDALNDKVSLPRALGALLGLAASGGHEPASQLAAAIADLFLKQGVFSTGTVAARYLEWRRNTPAVGEQLGHALDLIARGCPAERAGRLVWEKQGRPVGDADALLRTAIFGALFAGQPAVRRMLSFTDTAITHFDPHCQLASAALNAAIGHALTARPSPASMLRAAQDEVRDAAAAMRELYADIRAEIEGAATALLGDLAAAREDDHESGPSPRSVRTAFRLAFAKLMQAEDFTAGQDLAGALLGAFYGVDGIPRETLEAVLRGATPPTEGIDVHPRTFLRVLARGFAADRDPAVIAQLAPYVAIAFPEYGDAPVAASPSIALGGWQVVDWLRGGITAGQARVRKDGETAIATFAAARGASYADRVGGVAGVVPLREVVSVEHDGELISALIEAEPPGVPLSTPALPLRGRAALPVFAQLVALIEAAAASGVVLAGLRPEGIYVTRGPTSLVVSGVLPRADGFLVDPTASRVTMPFTSLHAAPEVTRGGALTAAADVFSACSVYVFMTQRRSIYQAVPVADSLRTPAPMNVAVELTGALDPEVEKAIRAGLDVDPSKRPSAADIARVLAAAGVGR